MNHPEGITQNVWDKAVELANFTMSNSNATNAKLIAVTIMEAKAEQREKDLAIAVKRKGYSIDMLDKYPDDAAHWQASASSAAIIAGGIEGR